MITINGERGIVRVENWDDVETMPGFTRDINPKEVALDSILGSYRLTDLQRCGLSSCHHKHYRGYVVATKDRRVTNIGHKCGRTHFGVDFETLAAAFDRDMRDKERRETLQAFKNRIEDYSNTVEQMKTEPKGATWLNRQLTDLKNPEIGLPQSVRRVLDDVVRTGSPILKRQRLQTEREAALTYAAANVRPDKAENEREDTKPKRAMIEEEVGHLRGFPVLQAENDIRQILIMDVEDGLKQLRALSVDTTTPFLLGKWAKWVGEIDTKLKMCRGIVEAGRLFFERENIAQLAELTESDADESRVMAFARRY